MKGVIVSQVLTALPDRLLDRGMVPELSLFNHLVGLVLQRVTVLKVFENRIFGQRQVGARIRVRNKMDRHGLSDNIMLKIYINLKNIDRSSFGGDFLTQFPLATHRKSNGLSLVR